MPSPVFAFVLGTQVLLVAANDPPRINAAETCRVSENELFKLFGDKTMATFESCMKQQDDAFEQIKKDWSTFTASERQHCFQPNVRLPSYVEWLTCLEIERNVRELRAKEADANAPRQSR